jgi:hypothetical protein
MRTRIAHTVGMAVLVASLAELLPTSVHALIDRCVFISSNNKLYYVVKTNASGSGSEFGVQVSSVVLSSGSVQSMNETAGEAVLTSVSGASTGDLLNRSGSDISAIKRTDIQSTFTATDCGTFGWDPAGAGGDGVLTLPVGGSARRLTWNGGAGGDPGGGVCTGATCLSLVAVDTASATTFTCADTTAACGIPAGVRTTFTRQVGSGSLNNAPTMVFPNKSGTIGAVVLSNPTVGEVDGQNVTIDDTNGSRVGNGAPGNTSTTPSQSAMANVDGFFLRRGCPACDLVIFAVDDGSTSFGVAASGFSTDSSGLVLNTTGAQDNQDFNTPTPTDTPTITPTPTPTPTPTTGQAVYDSNCAGCHRLGTYDTTGSAPNLYGDGSKVSEKYKAGVSGHKGITLSSTQISNLVTFLNNPTSSSTSTSTSTKTDD